MRGYISTVCERSLGIKINLWWGIAVLASGGALILLSRKSVRKDLEERR